MSFETFGYLAAMAVVIYIYFNRDSDGDGGDDFGGGFGDDGGGDGGGD